MTFTFVFFPIFSSFAVALASTVKSGSRDAIWHLVAFENSLNQLKAFNKGTHHLLISRKLSSNHVESDKFRFSYHAEINTFLIRLEYLKRL